MIQFEDTYKEGYFNLLLLFTTHETSDYSQSGYDYNYELTVQYFVNDEACSESKFINAINSQEQKADAK